MLLQTDDLSGAQSADQKAKGKQIESKLFSFLKAVVCTYQENWEGSRDSNTSVYLWLRFSFSPELILLMIPLPITSIHFKMHYYISIYGINSVIKFFRPITEVFISFKTNLEPQIKM